MDFVRKAKLPISETIFLDIYYYEIIAINSVRQTFNPDFKGLLLVFELIVPDKIIFNHKISYLVNFENFHFFSKNYFKF